MLAFLLACFQTVTLSLHFIVMYCMCIDLLVSMCTTCMLGALGDQIDKVRFLKTGVTGNCGVPNVGSGN